ncbi:DUF2599 domain-containing protein [Mobilicoccus sp.]|uniref:DUF2599 domain-containing protein n=1 Tax=Mobilicoccus sp. TaxID=2034349 RepID=UPI002896F496|nr:DUF2599 domain-containing protein [Mobilicoccus sp.]
MGRTVAGLVIALALVLGALGVANRTSDDAPRAAEASTTPTSRPTAAASSKAAASASPSTTPGRLVDDAEWVEREGERALKVTPNERLRESTDAALYDDAWQRVVRAVPEADTPGMRDQFVCHATFAANKEAWYLEPARPDVGYWNTVKAGCNPGQVIDVG